MLKLLLIVLALGCSAVAGNGQQPEPGQACSTPSENAPVLVSNPEAVVTFRCDHATPLQLIQAVGRQTRLPIGIVLGGDPVLLTKTIRNFSLTRVGAKTALSEAIAGTGYSLEEANGALELIAGDLTPRQRQVLDHMYPDFKTSPNQVMVELAAQMTMWMQMEVDHVPGFGGSTLYSPDDERFTFVATPASTTEEIADRIVALGSRGMWTLTTDPYQRDGGWTDALKVDPYQHYSNLPNADH